MKQTKQIFSAETQSSTPAAWLKVRGQAIADWYRSFNKTRAERRLRMCDTLSLGDRRFVALIELDGEKFLVGGGATSVALLASVQKSARRKTAKTRREMA